MFGVKTRLWLIKFVGVSIAYVLALQIILTSALATQMTFAPGDGQAICLGQMSAGLTKDVNHPEEKAPHHEACSICAFAAGPHWLPHQLAGLFFWRFPSRALFATAWIGQSPARGREPRTSQGPPQLV